MPSLNLKKRRVLITGGAGFIGSHLSEALLKEGDEVTVIDNLSTGRFENIAHLKDHPEFHFVIDSITNMVVFDRLASESDIIFHLAAAVGVELIVRDPVHTIETNVMGTEAVLKAAKRYRTKVLLASTSEVYGKGVRMPFLEDDDVVLGSTTRSRWSYAASKMVEEFLGLAYYRQMGLPVVIVRLFNTVGPRQTGQYGMVVPRFIRQALRGEPLTVYGDGRQTRCFCDVDDAVKAMLKLADSVKTVGKVFNIGSTEEVTIAELAQKILKLVHGDVKAGQIQLIPYEEAYGPDFEDMRSRMPGIQKIQEAVGWNPETPLLETLKKILQNEKTKEELLTLNEGL